MELFEKIAKVQRTNNFSHSQEMAFFLQNRVLLDNLPPFASHLLKAQEPFDIIRANIIIRSVRNKEIIEKAYKYKLKSDKKADIEMSLPDYMAQEMGDLPFFKLNEAERIYVPIFPANLNKIYAGDFAKLSVAPYKSLTKNYDAASIDPFDYYGPKIYNSYFTRLVLIEEKEEGSSYYDFDSETIFFVNQQGRLDAKICLFDHYLHRPNHNHMLQRVLPVSQAYYNGDREKLCRELVDNKLISSKIIFKINTDDAKSFAKVNKK